MFVYMMSRITSSGDVAAVCIGYAVNVASRRALLQKKSALQIKVRRVWRCGHRYSQAVCTAAVIDLMKLERVSTALSWWELSPKVVGKTVSRAVKVTCTDTDYMAALVTQARPPLRENEYEVCRERVVCTEQRDPSQATAEEIARARVLCGIDENWRDED
jgi:hypothetical protein